MTIKVTYNVTDIYISETLSATYINVSYEVPMDGSGVWGDITGTLSNQLDLQAALDAKYDDPTGTTAQYIRGDGSLATFPSLTGFVPYTGATTNVDLGEFELKAGQIEFDQTPTGVASTGVMRWNDTTGVSETTLKGGSVLLRNGVDLVARVVNKVTPNTTLTKAAYQAVRVSGAQGQRLAVAFAQANNDANSADTIGLVTETIATNQEGFIMAVGQLENINTTGSLQGETWVDGDVLYLSPFTAGRITNIKPVAPNHIIVIGYVEYAHANNGKIYVKVMNGWELGELHDVDTTGAVAGNVLKYNGTIWTPSSDVGITSLNGLTATTQTFATGTNGTDFNISSATSTHTFNLPSASALNRGLLTSADWTTFNNKQNALTNPVTGTGVAGQVSYWSGTNTQVGSNNLFWDATNNRLGIGTTTPTESMQVVGGNILIDNNRTFRTKNTGGSTLDIIKADTSNNLLLGSLFLGSAFYSYTNTNFRWFQYPSSVVTERMQLSTLGNLLIGSATDSGQRLQVTGDTLMRGSGNTSATTALIVDNSDGTDLFSVLNNGYTRYGNAGVNAPRVYSTSVGGGGDVDLAGQFLAINLRSTTTETTTFGLLTINGLTGTATTGTQSVVAINKGFAPTSGTATYTALLYNAAINQTGGANGITRGLYVNPTLTAAADWRSIETSNNSGWSYYGAGTANSFFNGSVGIGTTSLTGFNLRIAKNISGGAIQKIVNQDGTVQSDVTNLAFGFLNSARTAAASFTLSNYYHFYAEQYALGAGSVITNQFGFVADNTLTGATNNYGFYGNIASGTGRWNLYMNGTAANFISGDLGIGSATISAKVHITHSSGANPNFISQNSAAGSWNRLIGTTSNLIDSNFDLIFRIGASYTERLRFFATGNVGIGTGATDSGERFQVTGTMKVTGASTFGGNMTVGTVAVGTGMFWNNSNNRLGIGIAVPESQLHIRNATGSIISIESTSAGSSATPIETSINLYGYGQSLQSQISSQDRQASLTGGRLFFRVKDASNTLQDRFIIDRDGAATFSSSVTSTQFRLSALNTAPATASSTGTLGEIRIDADYIYICTATNTWKRVAIATW